MARTQGESDQLPTFAELLKRAGKGKNGQISQAEFPEELHLMRRSEASNLPGTQLQLKALFAVIDTSKDGQVSRQEWDKFLAGYHEFFGKLENGLLAITPGSKGERARVLWREKRALPEVSSPLYYRGRVYMVKDGGLVSCLEAKTGRLLYRTRLGAPGVYFASPVAGDGKVYAASRNGVVVVLAAGDQLKVLARNDLGEPIMATPAPVDGKLYLRTEQHLYAFGE